MLKPEEFVARLREQRATAILRTNDGSAAYGAMDAAIRGGFRIVEFTLTIPRALEIVKHFAPRPGLIVGAGTVLTVEQAREAAKAGAPFLVSPVVDGAVIEEAKRLGVAILPGAATPTEMLLAHRLGAPLVKVFPQTSPVTIRQILGPMPFLKLVPTAGVDETNAAAHLEAGAWAVGFVSSLFGAPDVEARARQLLAAVAAAKLP